MTYNVFGGTLNLNQSISMYCTAPLSPRKGRLRSFRDDDDDDDDDDDEED